MKLKYHIIIAALITLITSCADSVPVPPISVLYKDQAGNVYNYTAERGLEIQIEDAK